MKRLSMAAAVLATVVAIFLWIRLPPNRQILTAAFADGTVPGVLHVHSVRSDGRGTIEQIAHEAARAGLKFIIVTDHGDATRPPDSPVYREGVLCLDGVEISTSGGHYIAIDMPAAPYPLGGEPRDVVEDVKRLGGFGIAAHPDSPKPELQWKGWTAPFDGLEIINLDTAWRQKVTDTTWRPKAGLAARLLTYPFRPAETIASLISRSSEFYRWDALSRRRHVVTVPGADAHAQIAWRSSDPIVAKLSVPVPSYEASFRTLSMRVRPDRPLTGAAATDAALIFGAIRAGHLYTVVDGAATPPSFEFTASNTVGTVGIGDQLAPSGPVALHVRSNAPDGFTTTIWRGVDPIASDRTERDITVTATAGPGVYWVEIHAAGELAAIPWITSNAIYVRPPDATVAPVRPPGRTSRMLFDGRSTDTWRVVTDPTSLGALDVAPTTTVDSALRLRFGLSTSAGNQFVALSVATPQGIASNDRLSFSARAEKPMRISVQLQTEKARWQRSVFIDTDNQARTIFFDEFTPIGESETYRVPLADVRNVLFVIDRTNTRPGTSGRLWITSPALQQ
jgi:hypothetical protein